MLMNTVEAEDMAGKLVSRSAKLHPTVTEMIAGINNDNKSNE